jgi:lipoic acid synthetase
MTITATRNITRMPVWIRQNLGRDTSYSQTKQMVHAHGLHTVCEEAKCPNRGECWSRGTATFMLLGDTCTRACGFCAVKTGRSGWHDPDEPRRVSDAVLNMGLDYVVLTSVNRDELPDGGAAIFAETLKQLRQRKPTIGIEFLTPDFRGCQDGALQLMTNTLDQLPESTRRDLVWGHNVETVPRLYRTARKGAQYQRSLDLLAQAASLTGVEAKSALMLGLGETKEEVLVVLADLRAAGVDRVSLGQYLRPSLDHLPVERYVHPDEFAEYEQLARDMGFSWLKAGPMVRSSYFAEEQQGNNGTQMNADIR